MTVQHSVSLANTNVELKQRDGVYMETVLRLEKLVMGQIVPSGSQNQDRTHPTEVSTSALAHLSLTVCIRVLLLCLCADNRKGGSGWHRVRYADGHHIHKLQSQKSQQGASQLEITNGTARTASRNRYAQNILSNVSYEDG